MPTARSLPGSTPSTSWPALLPPALAYLSNPHPHPAPHSLPASHRYQPRGAALGSSGPHPRTLQDDLDDLDRDEDDHYSHIIDTRQYGHAWLVPLGRQNTHDEDADSAFSTSPHHGLDTTLDLGASPPRAGGAAPAAADAAGAQDDDAPVVDLDAEIEDADATGESGSGSGSGEEEEEDGEPNSGSEWERAGNGSD
ncbi:hypothetical protein DMC30DRAFT_415059 [Rhodotorula diobovata]|uniref:Uncharacterized protein n=1 Tax=Rhodotorula diobovata TaxID=5288 RepID=A0A5C5G097_9BASI|nr:hypothetical protein DMC30DRAFT_415059 [Rhodotorula diobovata]